MITMNSKLLVVDDEPLNREIISEFLDGSGYELVMAEDGEAAWNVLQHAAEEEFDAVILDRMMPRMDGMTLLKRVKQEARFKTMPVIMQTAAATTEQIAEGLQNGAYYYLTKPYDGRVLSSVVTAALSDRNVLREMQQKAKEELQLFQMMREGAFRFQTLEQARALAPVLATVAADAPAVSLGLLELLVNAVEHGNLGITTAEKTQLLNDGKWEEEIKRRLGALEHKAKFAYVSVKVIGSKAHFVIRDSGPGFNWRRFMDFDPERAFAPNGRGIALARQLSFPDLEFHGNGNEVTFSVRSMDE